MEKITAHIRPKSPEDAPIVSALEARLFGPGRFVRSAYRVREAAGNSAQDFAFVAQDQECVIGAVHLTPVTIGGTPRAVLLGPLIVESEYKGKGIGLQLITKALDQARNAGNKLVVLVGDLPYYARAGFCRVPPGQIIMPGPVDFERLLAAELSHNALDLYHGALKAQEAKNIT